MGCAFGFSRSSYDENIIEESSIKNKKADLNPSPDNWIVVKYTPIEKHLVVKIQYPNCKNYEGIKILLYKNTTIKQLIGQKLIDPHFSESKKFKSPIARFEPTEEGWDMALDCARLLAKKS